MQDEEDRNLRDIENHLAQYRRRKPDPKRIADVISNLMARRGYAQLELADELRSAWREAAGQRLARHSQPATLRRGVLQITVHNSIVLQELTFQRKQLLERLQKVLANRSIRDVRFRVGPLGKNC